jgi:hypothetical protein
MSVNSVVTMRLTDSDAAYPKKKRNEMIRIFFIQKTQGGCRTI